MQQLVLHLIFTKKGYLDMAPNTEHISSRFTHINWKNHVVLLKYNSGSHNVLTFGSCWDLSLLIGQDEKTGVRNGSGGGSTVSYRATASGEVPQAKHS